MRSASLHVNIIGKSNGVGLARDIDLLADALWATGHRVEVTIVDDVRTLQNESLFHLCPSLAEGWDYLHRGDERRCRLTN